MSKKNSEHIPESKALSKPAVVTKSNNPKAPRNTAPAIPAPTIKAPPPPVSTIGASVNISKELSTRRLRKKKNL